MRRSVPGRYYWSRYRLPTQMPRFDGPPPKSAPQNMNNTNTNEFIDTVDDAFPMTIRGPLVRPDVPEDQYVDSWYVCTSMTHNLGDYRPWSASAPPNAYRFRPYNEFDAKGREYVQHMRSFARYDARASRGKGSEGFPFREAYLTKMASSGAPPTPPPSLETIMDRAVTTHHRHARVLTPLQVQRDVGRLEKPLPCAGNVPVDTSVFPFRWNTEDWYEYEVAKVRNKRFTFVNTDETGLAGSEATYRIILEGQWEHHVVKLAEDVCMYIKDVGRQIVEEKLRNVRSQLQSLDGGALDPDLVEAFAVARRGPFGGSDGYDTEEVANFVRADLLRLEEQCVGVINRCNVPIPAATNLYDAQVSWPFVEKLEPWVRLAEYWTSSSDTSFTELEMSTAHYEFRKYFRVVVVKMPFQSSQLEQRLYGIRHWLHRRTSCEFHTTYRRNIVHDAATYPTEPDPAVAPTHEHHRLFSFALDWQSGPVGYLATELVREGDTWAGVAARLGCGEDELRQTNADVGDKDAAPEVGTMLYVPGTATRRLVSFGATPRVLPLYAPAEPGAPATRRIKTWEEAAAALGCGVEELQQANGPAALGYSPESGFDAAVAELNVPHTVWDATTEETFSATEPVYESDSVASVAARLGCSETELRAVNAVLTHDGDAALQTLTTVVVPPGARRARRVVHPQLRPQAATDALLARTLGEQKSFKLEQLPDLPDNASQFPHEYHTPTSRFPPTPQLAPNTENWMAYTAAYLDPQFCLRDEPAPVYNVNKLWPMQQVPGKVDQTPFEEDQTWLLHAIPVQQRELHHPEKDLQDLPFVNHEQFPRSLDWTAP